MLAVPSYREKWDRKRQWYEENGFWDRVITSEDGPNGGIDASEIAETARGRLSEIAQRIFRSKTPGAERMDAVMYLIGAIEKFGRMSKQEVQKIGIEIATLGLMEFRVATESTAPPIRPSGAHRRLSAERGVRRK
jgi:hypothetical protein